MLIVIFRTLTICLLLLADASGASAQTTRAEELRRQREEKAAGKLDLRRPTIDRILFAIEDRLVIERFLNPPRGFHLRLGGVGEGSGFGLGGGYRFNTDRIEFRASAAGSAKGYFLAEGGVRFPGTLQTTLFAPNKGPFVEVYGRRRDFPQEDFFGLGPDSDRDNRSNYALRETLARVTGGAHSRHVSGGVAVSSLDLDIGAGTDERFPSSTDIFSRSQLPGLGEQSFVVIEPYMEVSSLDRAVNDLGGGRYRVSFAHYNDQDQKRFSFNRFDADLRHFFSFLGGARIIALRGWVASTHADDDQDVPFYLQPVLGGAYTLRGFRTFRFRDRSALLMQAEYRWRVNEFVQGALFYDTGAVARRLGDIEELERDYGFGIRAGSRTGVSFRTDLAFGGREGIRLLVRFDDAF